MNAGEKAAYLANLHYVLMSDGSVDRVEERVFQEIAREIGAGYFDRQNAIEAACETAAEREGAIPGSVQIWAEPVDQNDGRGMVSIIVEDSGIGPPAELSLSVFDPFITGKPEGIGIGLALVKMVADEHGGSIVFERRQGRTRFTLTLPEASLAAVEETPS